MSEQLKDYDFHLPEELIAQFPVEPRDASRLLVVDRKSGTLRHRKFSDLPEYFDQNDLLVANNTRVLKARLLGHRIAGAGTEIPGGPIGGKIEFVMLEEKSPLVWEGLFHASAKYVPGLRFQIPTPDGKGLCGELVSSSSDSPSGTVLARFDRDPIEADAGEIPLPKYIRRNSTFIPNIVVNSAQDIQSYQTVFSKELGSAAAPTAGLHFTDDLISKLKIKGVGWEEVTLHVGVGTFRPVKTENLGDHIMHEERFEIKSDAAHKIRDAKLRGRKITAVGTTSVRTLESVPDLEPGLGRTSLFIRPGHFQFKMVDHLITNFHLPKSSLLMLVSTFAGRELVMSAYEEAVREKYRFFSYGDAMLIL